MAFEVYQQSRTETMRDTATAVRVGRFADERAWSEFMGTNHPRQMTDAQIRAMARKPRKGKRRKVAIPGNATPQRDKDKVLKD